MRNADARGVRARRTAFGACSAEVAAVHRSGGGDGGGDEQEVLGVVRRTCGTRCAAAGSASLGEWGCDDEECLQAAAARHTG